MSETYVVGYDGTPQARRAVDYAAERAKRARGRLHLVHVLEWSPFSFHTPEELAERHMRREQELARGRALLEPLVEELRGAGVEADCEVRHGHAAELLCNIATELEAAQIVIGRTGDSALSQRLLGGLALTLAQAAPVPLTIVP